MVFRDSWRLGFLRITAFSESNWSPRELLELHLFSRLDKKRVSLSGPCLELKKIKGDAVEPDPPIGGRSVSVTRVEGRKKDHKVFMYTLSTCVWCKRTKQFLKHSGVEYEYVDVDLARGEERKKIEKDFAKTGSYSYPTTVVDGKRVIKGFRVDEIKEALGL